VRRHVGAAFHPALRPRRPGRDRRRLDDLAGGARAPWHRLDRRWHRRAAAYGFVATFQDDPHFGRVLAAYGGIFVAGSLAWGMAVDGFRPGRYDVTGALICLVGVAVIMYAPRPA
jgi:drug/metabolite transporter superfamily protein YnfA